MGAGIGALLAAPLLTILYLAQQLLGLPFAAFDLFDWLARRLPGGLITSGIGAMVAAIRRVGVADTSAAAKTAEQGLAIAGLFLALVVAGAVLFAVLRRTRWSGIIAGLVLGALAGGAAPVVREADWRLRIGGLVGRPAELQPGPWPICATATSRRISSSRSRASRTPSAATSIGTTRWTGVDLQRVLADAEPQPNATHLRIRSVDGFHETLPLDAVRADPRIMLTYAWDG